MVSEASRVGVAEAGSTCIEHFMVTPTPALRADPPRKGEGELPAGGGTARERNEAWQR